ncbi:efflux RND transporter permease subunit [Sphingomonas jatrophae]|uniref:Multidrug efflux pump subunit AcrB n=1 Tax=Sphingomonas jatrophae TaxID=1166337 RepID=A0A1I6KZ65_9SPHN|nr:efflux RND transporter permease subunit [Sphingomonas jatrophae]SFR96288.1 Multidrug efflux pump subunit AcrB [Sphingomonas jatrophae]
MNFRNISSWAIRNPVAPIVLFIALSLAGIVSFMKMDVNQQPDVSFPLIEVIVNQPGAAPTELETQITQRVEAAVRGVSGVDEITSWISEGTTRVAVQFMIGTPVDRAANDVRDAVSRIRGELPEGILEPQVNRVDVEGGPIAYFSVSAVDMTLEQLSWFVDDTVAKRLLSIPGMAQVRRGGGVDREIRVILDPARMQAMGVTAAQVNAQLRQTNVNAAGGRAEIAGAEQAVRVLGNADNALMLSEKQIQLPGGRAVKLADIATVKDAYAEQRNVSLMGGRQVLSIALNKAKGASDVTVYDESEKVLKKLQEEHPGLKFDLLYTSVKYTKSQYHSAISAMWEGAVLAVLVVFLFLRDWRATVISAVAIPLSAIPAFWFMDLMGFTLNNLSLLALSLVAGVLVDDAIVEIENIVRHMRMGKTPYQASIDAADEIGLAVLATTMAIVAVFLPVGLMPGMTGQMFKQFGLTVVVAVLLSLAVARLITPMIAAYFLRDEGKLGHHVENHWLMRLYLSLLQVSLRHRWKTVGVGALALAATVVAFMTLPSTFMPDVDSNDSQVTVTMVPGTTLAQTQAVSDQAARILAAAPEVSQVFEDVEVGSANLFLTLKDGDQRERTRTEFERAYAGKLRDIADARVNFQSQQGGGFGRDIIVMLASSDPALLQQTAQKLVGEMSQIPELRAARVEGDLPRPEITIRPRLDLAANLGVTTAALSQTIRIATLGEIDQNAAKFSLSDRQIPIRVALDEGARRNLSTIENLPVPTASGGSVPLKVVADIGFGAGPSQLRRFNQERRMVIGADLAPGVVSGTANAKIRGLPTMKALPKGVAEVNAGNKKFEQEMMTNFVVAVVSGVLLVFAVLVLLYKRVLPPFVNMGSLLLAPLGGALALHIAGEPISMPVYIGLLMLLGIVAKNSILLVDFALEEMGKGIDKTVAIIDAGRKRAQPIVMTTVAMVAGMVPVSLSLGGDGSWRAPMGITVMGGLIMSTLLTLVIVPATFSLAVGFEQWIGPRLGRLLGAGPGEQRPTEPVAAE